MGEKNENVAGEESASELRGTLVRRLAVAGLLVAILLGVLAFFDHLATQPEQPEAPVFTQVVPVAPRKEVSQPVKPAEDDASTAPAPAPTPAEDLPPPAPAAAPADALSRDGGAPADMPRPATPARRSTTAGPTSSAVPVPQPAATPAPATRSMAQRPETTEETAPPESLSANRPAETKTAPQPATRLFSGFLLQAGVFSSAQRAEELHARLTLSGVPSTLETRVQVGPFRTRQEAEAAQAKLRELGVQTILVPPSPRR